MGTAELLHGLGDPKGVVDIDPGVHNVTLSISNRSIGPLDHDHLHFLSLHGTCTFNIIVIASAGASTFILLGDTPSSSF